MRTRAATAATGRSARTRTPRQRWQEGPQETASSRASLLRGARNDNGTSVTLRPFHLAFPVDDLAAARHFYGELLGCPEGRSADHWVDFDLHGHQIVAHLAPGQVQARSTNPVDGEDVPVPHFGLVLDRSSWDSLAKRLTDAEVQFV